MKFPSPGIAKSGDALAQGSVRSHSPRKGNAFQSRGLDGMFRFTQQDADDRMTDRGTEIGHALFGLGEIGMLLQKIAHRGLESAETEIEILAFRQGLRKFMGPWITLTR